MADHTRTMAQLFQAPTEVTGPILIPEIVANNFELQAWLIYLVQNNCSSGHDKRRPACSYPYFNKITSTMRSPMFQLLRLAYAFRCSIEDSPNMARKRNPLESIQTWDDHVSKFSTSISSFYNDESSQLRSPISAEDISIIALRQEEPSFSPAPAPALSKQLC
ncbi:hypothetical protein Tco_1030171 [Tanacetum coccineum]|uniref:Uncharacterized protein n=1 Tax=Tanacetum coccineum TaxID=301880 RepID=A0ABQ5G5W2_9ASTR